MIENAVVFGLGTALVNFVQMIHTSLVTVPEALATVLAWIFTFIVFLFLSYAIANVILRFLCVYTNRIIFEVSLGQLS